MIRRMCFLVPFIAAMAAGCSSGLKPPEFTITATDYTFTTTGTPAPGASLVTFKNAGNEVHHLQLLQLNPGKSLDDVLTTLRSGDLSKVPGRFEGGVGQSAPGTGGQVEARLTNGTYAMLCFVPTADGTPHFAKGMAVTFEVTGQQNSAAFEGADVKVVATDYAFEAPTSWRSGTKSIELENKGQELHEANLIRLGDGVSVDQVVQSLASGRSSAGGPTFTPVGGPQAVPPALKTVTVATLEKGQYALICFVPTADQTPHFARGMVRQFKVE